MMTVDTYELRETQADKEIRECLQAKCNFAMIAGAGSGKTKSLETALTYLRAEEGERLRRNGQQFLCITYTNRAVDVISNRVNRDKLFHVSTLHRFLWRQVKTFQPNIRAALMEHVIPARIEKKRNDDNGGESKKARAAREKISSLQADLDGLDSVPTFDYSDSPYSNYSKGQLNHEDVIDIAAYLISESMGVRQIIGQKYPYIFVDEAQDTFGNIVTALNTMCESEGLPVIGYFGDPMQQIYDKRAGDFADPSKTTIITKEENYRCSLKVIEFLNAFRQDVRQFAAGDNADIDGSVLIRLVKAEPGEGNRGRYTEQQIERASAQFDEALKNWGWNDREDVILLFLARQMIARRLGFPELHELFTGQFASQKAQEEYEEGKHALLKPLVSVICPLVQAKRDGDLQQATKILWEFSPAFKTQGVNAAQSLMEMGELASKCLKELSDLWNKGTIGSILKYCREHQLCEITDRLSEHLDRPAREETYNPDVHATDKGDWLADEFLNMSTDEIVPFVEFLNANTPYSTQHGVKGEEYEDVVVLFDDTDAAWNNYSFTKMLTPDTSGEPTAKQYDKSSKLAYVCFSRATRNLRILLFTLEPERAKEELISKKLFEKDQISIAN